MAKSKSHNSGHPKSLGEYEPTTFYIHSTDSDGNSATVRVGASVYRITPGLSRVISEFVADPKYPYRTHGDVVRDLLVHGWAHRLNNPEEDETFSAHIVHLDLIRRKLEIEAIQSAFEELRKYALSLRQAGATSVEIRAAIAHSITSLKESAKMNGLTLDFEIAHRSFKQLVFPK